MHGQGAVFTSQLKQVSRQCVSPTSRQIKPRRCQVNKAEMDEMGVQRVTKQGARLRCAGEEGLAVAERSHRLEKGRRPQSVRFWV